MNDEEQAKVLINLSQNVHDAQMKEYQAKVLVAKLNTRLERVKIAVIRVAHKTGKIDPKLKVAQIKQAEDQIVWRNPGVKMVQEAVEIAEDELAVAAADRKYHENILSLSKALLYSRSGVIQ